MGSRKYLLSLSTNKVLTVRRSSEDDLRAIFLAFGRVQTCIVNTDKRHAFVKMITRDEAVRAKEGMEHYKSPEMQLRVRSVIFFHSHPSYSNLPLLTITDSLGRRLRAT